MDGRINGQTDRQAGRQADRLITHRYTMIHRYIDIWDDMPYTCVLVGWQFPLTHF